MKNTKKTLSVLLAVILCLTLSIGAFAAETYSITINNSEDGHTYSVYQIFTGNLSDPEQEGGVPVLSNIQWGSGVKTDNIYAALGGDYASCTSAAQVAEKLAAAADADAFAVLLVNNGLLGTAVGTMTNNGNNYSIGGLAAGYYFVMETDTADGTVNTATDYIVQVVDNVTMEPKDGTVTSQKKVQDTNDSVADSTSGWQDSADYDIGDVIPFQITVTLPENFDSFAEFPLTIHDVQSAGLTLNNDSIEVFVGENKLNPTDDYNSTIGFNERDDCTFEIDFDDIKDIQGVTKDSTIVVTYTATLNENAVIGAQGNPNKSYVTFSNNPNGDGTGRTPDDTVIVFTYKVDVTKNDGDGHALAGAEFQLQKYNAANATWEALDAVTATGEGNNVFSFTGLDDGIYRLKETVTPNGYNTIDDIQFTVSAEHDVESDNPTLTGLSVTDAKYVDRETGADIANGAIELGTFTCTVDSGSIATTVVNVGGATLPETGGMGTTIFYVLGGLLVVGAVVVLVVRRRVREN